MKKLTIRDDERSGGRDMKTKVIGGFRKGELQALKSMPHEEAKELLLTWLDDRNDSIGTCWKCGYGVYGLWFDNEYAYLNVGTSSD